VVHFTYKAKMASLASPCKLFRLNRV